MTALDQILKAIRDLPPALIEHPAPLEVPFDLWVEAFNEMRAKRYPDGVLCAPIERANFLVAGLPICFRGP